MFTVGDRVQGYDDVEDCYIQGTVSRVEEEQLLILWDQEDYDRSSCGHVVERALWGLLTKIPGRPTWRHSMKITEMTNENH